VGFYKNILTDSMKKILLIAVFFSAPVFYLHAQDFVTRAKIEYEKKVRQPKDAYPEYRITYFDLLFAGNQSLYQAGRYAEMPTLPGRTAPFNPPNYNAIFSNFITGKRVNKKIIWEEDFIVEDSIPSIKWKIGQETRVIAGYECRKAIGRIFDSVYVVGFYAEELVIKGGPEGFQGLPGLILGIAIPRYNTTWFATKVELANIDESKIVPPTIKGKKGDSKTRLTKKMEQMGMKEPAVNAERFLRVGYFL
jgi:GLPGLI family protein